MWCTIIKIISLLISLIWLSGCSAVTFERGLNYEKSPKYSFDYQKGTYGTTIRKNEKKEKYINVGFGSGACGYYGLVGPLVFPIIPFWKNRNCGKIDINIWEHRVGINSVYILYQNQIYEPSKISQAGNYKFPLQIKSITDTAILVVEKKDGENFEIPFRYQHTFSFDLVPGR